MADTQTDSNVDVSNLLGGLPSSISSMLKASGDVAQKKADIDVQTQKALIEKTAPINEAYRKQVEQQGQTQQKIAGQLAQPFQVPQETASDYGQLGGMVAMLGVLLGKSGKQSATNVLSAIDGTLKGYQQGRKDMIAASQKEFDTNMKRLQAEATNAAAMLENITKLRSVDLEKANQEVAQLKAIFTQSIASSDNIVQNAPKAMELANSLKNANTNAGQLALRQAEFNRKLLEPVVQAPGGPAMRMDKDGNLVPIPGSEGMTKFGASSKNANPLGDGMPKTAQEVSMSVNRYQTSKNLEDLDTLLNDPKYAKFITPTTKFTPDILRRLATDFPELETKLARMQAGEFLIGGKALTGTEREILDPIYGWKGKTAAALRTQVKAAKQEIDNQLGIYETIYPGLKNKRQQWDDVYNKSSKPVIPMQSVLGDGLSNSATESKPIPTDADREYARNNPSVRQKFIDRFGVQP